MNHTPDDPYQPPQATLEGAAEKRALYTPLQIRLGSFIGGPLTAIYLLKANFDTLNDASRSRKTQAFGLVLSTLLILSLPALPDRFPNFVIPLAYSWTAGYIAETFQRSKAAIASSTEFEFESNWKVVGACLVGMVLFFLVAIGYLLAMNAAGLSRPA
jgi:hypothetical protein